MQFALSNYICNEEQIFRFANTEKKMSIAKELTILYFCGNISIVEKTMLATHYIASAGFLPQQQQVPHETAFS